jgi:hypothetical protein
MAKKKVEKAGDGASQVSKVGHFAVVDQSLPVCYVLLFFFFFFLAGLNFRV